MGHTMGHSIYQKCNYVNVLSQKLQPFQDSRITVGHQNFLEILLVTPFALPQASSSFLGDVLSWVGFGVKVEVEVEEAAKDVGDTKIPVKVELMREKLHNPLNEAGEDCIENGDKAPSIIDEL